MISDWMEWLGEHVNGVLLVVLAVVAGTWGFIAIADEVREGETKRFDEWAIHRLHKEVKDVKDVKDVPAESAEGQAGAKVVAKRFVPIGPAWLADAGRDLTALGSVAVLLLITLAVVGYLLLQKKYGAVVLVLAAVVGGQLLSAALKHVFDRPRPGIEYHASYVYTTSFPSGHSMMSAVVYLTLGTLLARFTSQRRLKFYFLFVALALTFLVGVSRVYMGVHWPTDVLAGWTAGLVWASLCWLAARYLQRRGVVEEQRPS